MPLGIRTRPTRLMPAGWDQERRQRWAWGRLEREGAVGLGTACMAGTGGAAPLRNKAPVTTAKGDAKSRASRNGRVTGLLRVLPVAVVISLLACRFVFLFSSPECSLLDAWMRARPARAPHADIVLVGVERSAVEAYDEKRPADCACMAIARDRLGRAIAAVRAGGARVIVVDMAFSVPCTYADGVHDRVLAQALAGTEVVLAARVEKDPARPRFSEPPASIVGPAGHRHRLASPLVFSPNGIARGVWLLQTGATTGPERARAAPLQLAGRELLPLSLEAYLAYKGVERAVPEPAGRTDMKLAAYRGAGAVAASPGASATGDLRIPIWSTAPHLSLLSCISSPPGTAVNPTMLISWAGPVGTFPVYPLSQVEGADAKRRARWFRDKIVVFGSLAERHATPMGASPRPPAPRPPLADQSDETTMSGMEIHANALDSLLQERFIRALPEPATWALVTGVCVLAALAFWGLPASIALLVLLVEMAAVGALAWFGARQDVWVYTVLPWTAAGLSGLCSALLGYTGARVEVAELAEEVEARDTVTSTLVHDLKQPIAAISSLAAALRAIQERGAQAADSADLLQHIQQQAAAALAEIDELLAASSERTIVLSRERFDFAALAADLAVAQSMKSPVHRVEVRAPDDGAWLSGDPSYLGRALSNLVDNAIKYWPEGGTVVVEFRVEAGRVVVQVIDQGMGISPEQQARVFARFHRAVPEEARIPGTGIGLFSVRRIAEAHGGSVGLASAPGLGSTFTLRLPVEPPDVVLATHPEPRAGGRNGEQAPIDGMSAAPVELDEARSHPQTPGG